MRKELKLNARHLRLISMTVEELDRMVLLMEEGSVRSAYAQLLVKCRKNEENQRWYLPFKVVRKDTGAKAGVIGFEGIPVRGAVRLMSDICDSDILGEAVETLVGWAFQQPDLFVAEVDVPVQRAEIGKVYEKLHFTVSSRQEEYTRYVRVKPKSNMAAIYMLLGMSCGISIGTASGNMSLGMSIGLLTGFLLGWSLDRNDQKRRREVCAPTQSEADKIAHQ